MVLKITPHFYRVQCTAGSMVVVVDVVVVVVLRGALGLRLRWVLFRSIVAFLIVSASDEMVGRNPSQVGVDTSNV